MRRAIFSFILVFSFCAFFASLTFAQEPPVSLTGTWKAAMDPENVGSAEHWEKIIRPDSSDLTVPGPYQSAFPHFRGVVWLWKKVDVPQKMAADSRFILEFEQVAYACRIWVNGVEVGAHEGVECGFRCDVTDALNSGEAQALIALRVVNPGDRMEDVVDGISQKTIPSRPEDHRPGGILGEVSLQQRAAVYVDSVQTDARLADGSVTVTACVVNSKKEAQKTCVSLTLSDARKGAACGNLTREETFPPGKSTVRFETKIKNHHAWNLNDPFLYRATVRVEQGADELSTRFGFRDFRFTDGFFRLNGKRIYVKCTHTSHFPTHFSRPVDLDLICRDLIHLKSMGFNMVRFIWGLGTTRHIEIADELGMMVYQETEAAFPMQLTPGPDGKPLPNAAELLETRYCRALEQMVENSRNHPSVVIYGLLNETRLGPAFDCARAQLPFLQGLDSNRLVILESGSWHLKNADETPLREVFANPGETQWRADFWDLHPYQAVPHTAWILRFLRKYGAPEMAGLIHGHNNFDARLFDGRPIFLSEYGIGSAADVLRSLRFYEQNGTEFGEDYETIADFAQRFQNDWNAWKMNEAFGRPEDFFEESKAKMARQRELGINALRANPLVISHSVTNSCDPLTAGEGLATMNREFKYGTFDAMKNVFSPLRWCVFAEPVQLWAGEPARFEAVLVNEDVLKSGEYPARFEVFGPDGKTYWRKSFTVKIPENPNAPFALPQFDETAVIDGPTGQYRAVCTLEKGGAAAGEETEFFVTRREDVSFKGLKVMVAPGDERLQEVLKKNGAEISDDARVLLVGKSLDPGFATQIPEMVNSGRTVVFLQPWVLLTAPEVAETAKALFPAGVPTLKMISSWLYLNDDWAKPHAYFHGLPLGELNGTKAVVPGRHGGLMSNIYYRDVISMSVLQTPEPPTEAVAGAIHVTHGYDSGLTLAVWDRGENDGKIVLTTLKIRENPETPVGLRFLRNFAE